MDIPSPRRLQSNIGMNENYMISSYQSMKSSNGIEKLSNNNSKESINNVKLSPPTNRHNLRATIQPVTHNVDNQMNEQPPLLKLHRRLMKSSSDSMNLGDNKPILNDFKQIPSQIQRSISRIDDNESRKQIKYKITSKDFISSQQVNENNIQTMNADLNYTNKEEKQEWLKCIQEENFNQRNALEEVRKIKASVLQRIEELELNPNLQNNRNDSIHIEKEITPEIQFVNQLQNVSHRSLYQQWNDTYESLHDQLKEQLWLLILSHIGQFVRGHPLASSLSQDILHETILEIATQIRGIVGSATAILVKSGDIRLPLVNKTVVLKDDGMSIEEFQETIGQLLHSHISKFNFILFGLIWSYCNIGYSSF